MNEQKLKSEKKKKTVRINAFTKAKAQNKLICTVYIHNTGTHALNFVPTYIRLVY